ncbi:MAG: hypothetical protein ACU83U_10920 [Gammaproteobacteria bacterium]
MSQASLNRLPDRIDNLNLALKREIETRSTRRGTHPIARLSAESIRRLTERQGNAQQARLDTDRQRLIQAAQAKPLTPFVVPVSQITNSERSASGRMPAAGSATPAREVRDARCKLRLNRSCLQVQINVALFIET